MTHPTSLGAVVDIDAHPLDDAGYRQRSREAIDATGALIVKGFLRPDAVRSLAAEADALRPLAFHSSQTHSVYLETPEPERPWSDARSRTVTSTKGAVTTDLLPASSALRTIYDAPSFRGFLSYVLGTGPLHEYADPLSSININYYAPGQELGWHFDNSAFSVTLLLQAPVQGGSFEFVESMRDSGAGDDNETRVALALDGGGGRVPATLGQDPGDLVLFRGRDALHRVTPVEGDRTRILVVLAYNTEPGLSLSANARMTFFGRLD